MNTLCDAVIAAGKAVTPVQTPESGPLTEQHQANIIIAQVREIMNHFSGEDVLLTRIVAIESHIAAIESELVELGEPVDTDPIPVDPISALELPPQGSTDAPAPEDDGTPA